MCSMLEDDESGANWRPRSRGRCSANSSRSLARTVCSAVLIVKTVHNMARSQQSWMIPNQSSKKSKQPFRVRKTAKIKMVKMVMVNKGQVLQHAKVRQIHKDSCQRSHRLKVILINHR